MSLKVSMWIFLIPLNLETKCVILLTIWMVEIFSFIFGKRGSFDVNPGYFESIGIVRNPKKTSVIP